MANLEENRGTGEGGVDAGESHMYNGGTTESAFQAIGWEVVTVKGRTMAPQGCSCLNAWNPCPCYDMWERGIIFVERVKVAIQMIFE